MPIEQTKVAIDLGKLAVKRCDEAFGSVAQLLEGPDVYGLGLVMAAHFIEVAALDLQQGMERQSGKQPTYGDCQSRSISEVLDLLEVPYQVIEAKK